MVKDKIRGYRAPDGGTTMVVEMGGSNILGGLAKPIPFLGKGYLFPEEYPIDPKQKCWGAKLVYQLECSECGAQYVGTTGHSVHRYLG